jgi:hypothetical protein
VVERALENPKTQRKCGPLKGDVQVWAGRMSVRLRFNEGRVEVVRGSEQRPRASVRGDLETLTDVSLDQKSGSARGTITFGPCHPTQGYTPSVQATKGLPPTFLWSH